jgi:AcrR family transcriptional regulator
VPVRGPSSAARRKARKAPAPEDPRDAILDAALALASERGWSDIHLHDVAARMGLPLAEVGRLVPDKDALGNRLFARAAGAMLALGEQSRFRALPAQERIFRAMTAWLDALAPHRAAARDILLYKLAPAHLHHQAALVVALSRTVQWIREAAGLVAAGRGRRREEVRLTLLLLATLLFWFLDGSPGQERTHEFLRRRLEAMSDRLAWS